MAAPIIIRAELNTGDVRQAAQEIERTFKSAIDNVNRHAQQLRASLGNIGSGISGAGGGGGAFGGRSIRNAADETLKLAQAQARLQQVSGNTTQSIRILQGALDGSTASTLRQLTAQTQLQRLLNQQSQGWRRYASTIREAGESIQQAGYTLTGLTIGVINIGQRAVQSAISIDKQVNSLRALTGSAEKAEARFRSLFALAQQTPGLTTNLALTLDAQLRAANVSQGNIDKLLPAVGRINAVSPLGDPQKFAQNLIQLITQNFERTDLKELVGQSPIAGRIISQIFDVENPTNAKAIRKAAERLGITSTDAFFKAFGEAAANNPALANVTESIETQIGKLQDRIAVALRPLGLSILRSLVPVLERIVPVVERALNKFAAFSPELQNTVLGLVGLAAAIGPVTIAFGGLIQTVGAIGNLVSVVTALGGAGTAAAGIAGGGGLAALIPVLGTVGIAVGALAGIWISDFGNIQSATRDAFQQIDLDSKKIEAIQGRLLSRLGELRTSFQGFSDQSSASVRSLADVLVKAFNFASDQGLKKFERELGILTSIANVAFGALSKVARVASAIGGADPQLPANPLQTPIVPLSPKRSTVLVDEAAAGKLGRRSGITSGSDSATSRAESAARQLRAANEEFIRAQAKATADLEEKLIRNRIEADKEAFEQRQISADVYYKRLTENELRIQDIAKQRLESDLAASRARAASAKAGSPEQIRERGQALEIEKQLQLIELERPNLLRKIRQEIEATAKADVETASKAILNANKLINDQIGALRNAQRIRPQNELNIKEIEIQGRVTAGLITQQQATDELILTRRQYRDVLIQSAEEELASLDANNAKNAQAIQSLKERIAQTKTLGAELTSVERLQRAVELDRQRLQEQLTQEQGTGRTVGQNFDLKEQIARQQSANEIAQAEEDAALSIIRNRERIANATILSSNRANAIFLDHLAQQKSVTEATADAMISAYEGVAGSIDKGIDSLTRKLGIFGDAISGILKSITRSILTGIFAPGQGGQGGRQGGGSVIGNLFGGLFGGGQQGGGAGGFGGFLTPGFNPAGGSILGGGGGGGFGNILGGLLGGGLSAPASVSIGGLPAGRSFPVGLSSQPGLSGRAGGLFGNLFGGLGNLFGGLGFGKAAGSGGALASALPLLGIGLGSSLGGDSGLGKILGGIGGGLLGVGLSAAPAIFGAGGLLASPAIAALFSNPITAVIGAALLPTAFLIGRARQRRKDEKASGDFLQNAIDSIRDLRGSVARDEINGTEARKIFRNEILATFKEQIGTLKTKSVRESRLTNQVRDLEKLYQDEVAPEIEKQARRKKIFGKLTPEFATGGVMPYDGFAFLHKGEIIANPRQQTPALVNAAAAAGVPGVQAVGGGGSAPAINLYVSIGLSKSNTQEIVVDGMDTDTGRALLVNLLNSATKNQEYKRN